MTTPTAHRAEPIATAEGSDALSRLSLSLSLLALFIAALDIGAILLVRLTQVPPPSWAFTAQRVIPQVDVLLGAASIALNLFDVLRIVARRREFDPREAEREFAVDDLAAILGRVRQGCAVRVVVPLGLIGALVALLLSVLLLPGNDGLRVTGVNLPQTCTTTGVLAPFRLELDNSAGTVDVSWSASPVEALREGTPWAQVQPAQGTVQAGQRARVVVIPNVLVCQFLARAQPVASGHTFAVLLLAPDATFHVQVTSTGRTRRTTTLAMQIAGGASPATPSPTPTPTPRAAATHTPVPTPRIPTPTPRPIPPHAALQVSQNRTYSESCTSVPASAYTVTLNNRGSNVPIDWQFRAAGGWASASPSSARIGAGQTATVRVSPSVCPIGNAATTYQATLHLGFPQGGSQPDIALSDTIAGPAPHPALVVTQNQNYYCVNCLGGTYAVALSNTGGNVPVQWQFVPTETNNGVPWATSSPASGTVAAGGTATFQVSPQSWTSYGVTYHATLQLTFPQGGLQPDIALTYGAIASPRVSNW
jgi:hypothetical protein